jgi:hypothetical protein
MDILETATTKSDLDATHFHGFAELFFKKNNLEMFLTKEEANEILKDGDTIAKVLHKLDPKDLPQNMLMMGSIFGEALILVLEGRWLYSNKQQRWVIECVNVEGEIMELNIFHKLKKYFLNGDEDSLNYYFELSRGILTGRTST